MVMSKERMNINSGFIRYFGDNMKKRYFLCRSESSY
jgi:hypothetical protein